MCNGTELNTSMAKRSVKIVFFAFIKFASSSCRVLAYISSKIKAVFVVKDLNIPVS